ncbi:1-pyrroline-5-carboxylate dehydrogenase [bacterium HR21]|nr:1-pyrroline-5-carboxylate dehydrogenase [bacterium HR21]
MNWDELREKHMPTLERALGAVRTRTFYAHWAEVPSGKIYGETAHEDGRRRFEGLLHKPFQEWLQQGDGEWVGGEISPYGFPLGVHYRRLSVATAVERAQRAQRQWQRLDGRTRAVLLLEALEQAAAEFFPLAYATMHTTGQGFVMAFQASGPHAFDRALEAIATGVMALEGFAPEVLWRKPLGKGEIAVRKRFQAVPKGLGAVIGCSTFPVWNAFPGVFANLITGNACLWKPHPTVMLPVALVVARLQRALERLGIDPNVLLMLPCTLEEPLTWEVVEHPAVRIVDYTGSPAFGTELERRLGGKVVFTEKAGVNSVLLHSVADLGAVLDNLAFSLCLYSGQMCTAPQNIFVPETGVETPDGRLLPEEVAARLCAAIDALVHNPKAGPPTLGALQNEQTLQRLRQAEALGLPVLRASTPLDHPDYPDARTATPLLLEARQGEHRQVYGREWFGPIAFLVRSPSADSALQEMAALVRSAGALVTAVYTTEEAFKRQAADLLTEAGTSVAFNFVGPVWVNQSAAYSDFHGAGVNAAGNASFTDLGYVAARFGIVHVREVV